MKTTSPNNNNNNGRGRGAGAGAIRSSGRDGLQTLNDAFDFAATTAARVTLEDTTAAEYQLVYARLTTLNLHLIACGCPSLWIAGEWEPSGWDAIQAAMLALQLHRRKLRLVRDDSGAEKLDCATTTTTAANAVVWRALRASLHGRAGAAYESAMASAIAYEDWRVNVLPSALMEDVGGETTVERSARRAAALPAVIQKLIEADKMVKVRLTPADIAEIIKRHRRGESGYSLADRYGFNRAVFRKLLLNNYEGLRKRQPCRQERATFAAQLRQWVEAVNRGVSCEQAAIAAGFHYYGKRNFPQGATSALVQKLKHYGFNIPDASWRVKLPRVRRWFKRPNGGGAGAGVCVPA